MAPHPLKDKFQALYIPFKYAMIQASTTFSLPLMFYQQRLMLRIPCSHYAFFFACNVLSSASYSLVLFICVISISASELSSNNCFRKLTLNLDPQPQAGLWILSLIIALIKTFYDHCLFIHQSPLLSTNSLKADIQCPQHLEKCLSELN